MPIPVHSSATPILARVRFSVPVGLTATAFASAVGALTSVRLEPAARYARTYLDTHDWRLWRRGTRLAFELAMPDGGASIVWIPSEAATRRFPAAHAPRFAAELPAATARDDLVSATQGRALLPLGRTEGTRRLLRVLNREGKTVVNVWWQQWNVLDQGGDRRGGVHRVVEIEPLTGYARAASRLQGVVHALPGITKDAPDELATSAAAAGRQPGDYTSKFNVVLDPAATAAEATRQILTTLLAALRANLDGTLADVDTEFLHDLRVAVRRTRSALGQLRDVFDPMRIARFVTEFGWLGEATGPCRDADVHLEELSAMMAEAPDDLRPGTAAFASWLGARRSEAYLRLVDDLRSPRFARLLERWSRFLARPWPAARTARGGAPVADVAAERIARAHRRLVRHVATLGPDLPPVPMHRLRIDAKKLRYLLEFFASLCGPEDSESLIAELKLLQDELGSFHDAYVQRQGVLEAGAAMVAGGIADAGALLAMGHLAAGLEARQRAQGEAFLARIPRFVAPETGDAFAGLVRGTSGR